MRNSVAMLMPLVSAVYPSCLTMHEDVEKWGKEKGSLSESPGAEESGRLQSMGSMRVGHD